MTKYRVSTFPFRDFSLEQFVGGLADIGISSIELGKPHFQDLSAEQASILRAECGLPFKSMLSTEDIAGPEGLEDQIAILNIAQNLSVSTVSIASGGTEEATEYEIDLIIDRLKSLTEEAERRNLKLQFYSHGGWMAYNLERCERIFSSIVSDSFGYYYCPYHFYMAGDDPVVALERLADRLMGVYFDCGVDPITKESTYPLWVPEIDYHAVCQAIKRTAYTGEIMLISFGTKQDSIQMFLDGIEKARNLVDQLMS